MSSILPQGINNPGDVLKRILVSILKNLEEALRINLWLDFLDIIMKVKFQKIIGTEIRTKTISETKNIFKLNFSKKKLYLVIVFFDAHTIKLVYNGHHKIKDKWPL